MTPEERREYNELVLLNVRARKAGKRLTPEQQKRYGVLDIKRYDQIRVEQRRLQRYGRAKV
jgi:hypothetical protein